MNYFKKAQRLLQENSDKSARMMQTKTNEGTVLLRIIVGEEDVVIFGASEEQIQTMEILIAQGRMERARLSLRDENWTLPQISSSKK